MSVIKEERARTAANRFYRYNGTFQGDIYPYSICDAARKERGLAQAIAKFKTMQDAELFLKCVRDQYTNEPGLRD